MRSRFAGFELDSQRAELSGPDGVCQKLRPKTLQMLSLFVANTGKVLSKPQLMDAVWPEIHVGEDSLFQCIREVRTALGDDQRQIIRLISGQGYLFTAEVEVVPRAIAADETVSILPPVTVTHPSSWRLFVLRHRAALAVAGLGAAAGLVLMSTTVGRGRFMGDQPPAIAVMHIAAAADDTTSMAAAVTTRLADGLAQIENIRLIPPQASGTTSPDFLVSGELRKVQETWEVRARMTRAATGEIVWTALESIASEGADPAIQHSRLVAGIGHPLAVRINELLNADLKPAANDRYPSPGVAKVAIEQASNSIMETSRDRFATAQSLLENALADDPDNVDLAVALAALQLRGVQLEWYQSADRSRALNNAKAILERALRHRPNSLAVLDTYCRSLNAAGAYVESLVACARALNFDPWNGQARFHIGLAQLQLGRFDDALATFKEADRADTPKVSRWTWKLGAGLTYLVMGRSEEAMPWLKTSIAITPASGRSYMLLSAAYKDLGQADEAKAAMAKGMALRPGSTLGNVIIATQNSSATYVAATQWINDALLEEGLPEE